LGVTLSSIVAVLGARTILPMRENVLKRVWLSLITLGKVRCLNQRVPEICSKLEYLPPKVSQA
jgi:hypothetical protein